MPHTVTIEPKTGIDKRKKPAYGAAVSYPARIEDEQSVRRDDSGNEIVTNITVWVGTTERIGRDDKVTFPPEFNPRNPPIQDVEVVYDEGGIHHVMLFL